MINSFISTLTLLQSETSWLLASEKVNSVLTVVLLIFALFIAYLMFTNKRISDLEKRIDE